MAKIVCNGISGQKSAHEIGQSKWSAFDQDMGMIGHEGPGENAGFRLGGKLAQTGDKILTVFFIIHNRSALNSPNNHMVQCTRVTPSSSLAH